MNRLSKGMKGSDGRIYHSDLFNNQKHIIYFVTESSTPHLHRARKRMARLIDDFSGKNYAFYVICDMPEQRFIDFVSSHKSNATWLLDQSFQFTDGYLSETLDRPVSLNHDLSLIVDADGSLLQRISYHRPVPDVEKKWDDR